MRARERIANMRLVNAHRRLERGEGGREAETVAWYSILRLSQGRSVPTTAEEERW